MFHLVTGGSGSGKSAFAENLICKGTGQLYYIATMIPRGEETRQKILRHQQMRAKKGFITIEGYTNLQTVCGSIDKEPRILLECMSNLIANELYEPEGARENTVEAVLQGVQRLQQHCSELVVVTNEVCSECAADISEMRQYKKTLGTVNQRLAELADTVTEVVYGIAVTRKGKSEEMDHNTNNEAKLVIGGAYQGKQRYAEETYHVNKWVDGNVCEWEDIFTCEGILHFEQYIKRRMEARKEIQELAARILEKNPQIVIVSTEIGYGLVPIDAFDRQYREQVGRICTDLAERVRYVDRVVCGIGTRLKRNKKISGMQRTCEEPIHIEKVLPQEIEAKSFELITEELGDYSLLPGTEAIVKRCIHTSADFEYAKNLVFTEGATERALQALRAGASIVTDTQMGKAGINKKLLAKYGGKVHCFMSDEDVAELAKMRGTTRAAISMEKAAKLNEALIFAIGNAPTALVRLYELVIEGKINPELIIAVPVGFVNVIQSKECILNLKNTPAIVARGRKGGSNIAACICNALLYQLRDQDS